MRVLLLNQTFWPDVMATGQYLAQVAVALKDRKHQVTVVTGQRAYDDPSRLFPRNETWQGIEVHRVAGTGFGKKAKWRRAADFASFLVSCCVRLITLPRQDVVVALTSPPLISFLGALAAVLYRGRFVYWVMDLNPDEAEAAGWLRKDSLVSKVLHAISRFSMRRAHKIVVLDRFMRDRILAKGIAPDKIEVIAPWSHDDDVRFDPEGREQFRKAHGLTGNFVVMYSGNHSPCHPLNTLLRAARARRTGGQSDSRTVGPSDRQTVRLSDCRTDEHEDGEAVFVFVGGGSEFAKVKKYVAEHGLKNVLCLPYQPLDQLSASLSAADLHVVVMGDPFVGLIHPCKIYNILSVRRPVLYIGPEQSHVVDLFQSDSRPVGRSGGRTAVGNAALCYRAAHGDVAAVVAAIRGAALEAKPSEERFANAAAPFRKEILLPRLIEILEMGD